MGILACGINHKTAAINLRERLAVNKSGVVEALEDLISTPAVNEAVLISTCNRTEIIAASDGSPAVGDWLARRYGLQQEELQTHCYQHAGYDAVRHLIRVTSGLDSMLLGEPQIFGQVKQAYQVACDYGSVGGHLQQLFPAIFSASKQVRSETALGEQAISIAFLVMKLAKRIFTDIGNCRVLFIGASDTNELVATHLYHQGVRQMAVANRSILKAEPFAEQFGARVVTMTEVSEQLEQADIVVTATASQLPILGKGAIESAQRARKHRPLLLVDLAVPRDIEKQATELDNVYLYNIDDLQEIILENESTRLEAAAQAEQLAAEHAQHYIQQLRVVDAADMISRYRQKAVEMRESELSRAVARLQAGKDPEAVMQELARNITNKLIHQPTVQLRQAAYQDEMEKLLIIKKLFDI
ncbi:MAG: glutamyl-tRNA reductase [Coxiellaceae bacterium]|nr:glutamyl-tRNA reductase [Coxiellaceae bacterium]